MSWRRIHNDMSVQNPARLLQIDPIRGRAAILLEYPPGVIEINGLLLNPTGPGLLALVGELGRSHFDHIDPFTSQITRIHSFSAGEFMTHAVWDALRGHYWVSGATVGSSGIFRLDPVTYALTQVVTLPSAFAPRELAYSPTNNMYYLAGEGPISGEDRNGLFQFDPDTLSLVWVGLFKGSSGDSNTFNNVRSLSWDPISSRLLAADSNTLIQVDQATGKATTIGRIQTWNRDIYSVTGLEFAVGNPVAYPLPEPSGVWLTLLGVGILIAAKLNYGGRWKA